MDVNLSESDLRGTKLKESFLILANLTKADLSYAQLTSASLILANLSQTSLNQTNLAQANLTKANLTEAKNFTLANLHQVIITGAIMPNGKVHSQMNWWKQTGICLKNFAKIKFDRYYYSKQ
jgi:uncharacterized protein YjbI with pentapeptide repeats